MNENEFLAEQFEAHRPHLRAVAYRMLGSFSDVDDALQEAWIRVNRAGANGVQNMGGWLTTIVARVSLNMLESRKTRREEPLETYVPDPIISSSAGMDPEEEAILADSVGLGLLVVLDTLRPAERLAFVLHDVFAVSFDEIAEITGRTPAAARQLASRARRRVQGAAPSATAAPAEQQRVVDAFLAAAREGNFDRLVAVLDPEVELRADGGALLNATAAARGAAVVAGRALLFAHLARYSRPALVNGAPGFVVVVEGKLVSVMSFAVREGRITAIHALTDPERLARVDFGALGDR